MNDRVVKVVHSRPDDSGGMDRMRDWHRFEALANEAKATHGTMCFLFGFITGVIIMGIVMSAIAWG